MSMTSKALIWAALIIAFAFVANGLGVDDELSLIFVGGIAAMAVIHLYRGRRTCAKEG